MWRDNAVSVNDMLFKGYQNQSNSSKKIGEYPVGKSHVSYRHVTGILIGLNLDLESSAEQRLEFRSSGLILFQICLQLAALFIVCIDLDGLASSRLLL